MRELWRWCNGCASMKKMIVEITRHDDKTDTYKVVDFPYVLGPYMVLRLEGFVTEYVPNDFIKRMKTYFK